MHKSRLGAVIVDCQDGDLFEHAEFWSAALGSEPESAENPVNPQFIRLAGSPREAQVLMQKVDHPSRIHIDIESDDIEAEVERLQALGAVVVERMERWVVMEAPSKHRFCIINPIRPDFDEHANQWG